MKKLLALLLVISSLSFAKQKEYTLPIESIDDQTDKITFIADEWQYVTEASDFKLLVEKGAIGSDQEYVQYHSVTVFNKPFFYDTLNDVVDKIYTYGIMNCKDKVLVIGNELYVRPDEIVIYRSGYEYGTYVINMDAAKSLRIQILNAVCNKSI